MSAHAQIHDWPAASGWRRTLALYVVFILLAAVWKLGVWLTKQVPGGGALRKHLDGASMQLGTQPLSASLHLA